MILIVVHFIHGSIGHFPTVQNRFGGRTLLSPADVRATQLHGRAIICLSYVCIGNLDWSECAFSPKLRAYTALQGRGSDLYIHVFLVGGRLLRTVSSARLSLQKHFVFSQDPHVLDVRQGEVLAIKADAGRTNPTVALQFMCQQINCVRNT